MGYQFFDGFDSYGNNYLLTAGYPWDTISSAGIANVINTDFRFSPPSGIPGGCVVVSAGQYIRKNLNGNPATVFNIFGVKFPQLPPSSVGAVLQLWDAGTVQVTLGLNSTGQLQFYRAFSTAIGSATPNATIAAGVWYGFAVAVTIDPSAGVVQLFINGNSVAAINSSGLNTRNTANSQANQVSLGDSSNQIGIIRYDDFQCFDSSGAFLNALPGFDTRIFTKLPSGAGNYTNWTPNGLASNWQNVSQQPPNTSDYNANNVASTKDSYAVPSAGLSTSPFGVIVRASLERDDAGPHTPNLMIRSGSTDGVGPALPALGSSYAFYDYAIQNDPATGLPWLGSNADAAQPGIVEG